jgi:hypothetical protein
MTTGPPIAGAAQEVGKSDQETLLKITRQLVTRICGESLIARFFLHFIRPKDGNNYIVRLLPRAFELPRSGGEGGGAVLTGPRPRPGR